MENDLRLSLMPEQNNIIDLTSNTDQLKKNCIFISILVVSNILTGLSVSLYFHNNPIHMKSSNSLKDRINLISKTKK